MMPPLRQVLLGTAALLASFTLSTAASAQVDSLLLTTSPVNPGPGDPVDFIVSNGTPGDRVGILVSSDPGPTLFPVIGQMSVGLTDLDLWDLGQFDATGTATFRCGETCDAADIPFYAQAFSLRLAPLELAGKSDPLTVIIDGTNIIDCNGNGVDDDCDIRRGNSQDCNDNGIPDECDPDCDGDGIPDDCDLVIDSYCVENLADDGCTSSENRIVWIQEISPREFAIVEGGLFVENADGTAAFSGTIQNVGDPDLRFDIDVLFSGRIAPGDPNHPPAGSPKPSAGSCSVDEANYVYYTDLSGTFTGRGDYEGAVYALTIRGAAAQMGDGANQKNERFGLSSWYDLTQLSPPNSGSLPTMMQGDFNFDLVSGCDCEPCDDAPLWPKEAGDWDLSGTIYVKAFSSKTSKRTFTIDCMTASYDGDIDLRITGYATNPSAETIFIDFTYTVSHDGSNLKSYDGSNDFGSITFLPTNQTIQLRGEENNGYAGRLKSSGSGTADLKGWFEDKSGNHVGDFDNPAIATCTPCN